ncbi:hypothetical protein ACFYOF_20740 [Streptomyces sp. NPDC007148]|uniref:hypothetical protein n=1 Tax=Streptomyces sp. NPDC007148 TaxID=3364775 RepID=UPI0036D01AB9
MIAISYTLGSQEDRRGWETRRNCGSATRGQLLWSFFPASIAIRTDDAEWRCDNCWIPLLHFALSLLYVCERLREEEEARYDFTEVEGEIEFRRRGEWVTVAPSDSSPSLRCTYIELCAAAVAFARRVVFDLAEDYPALRETEVAVDMLERAARISPSDG